MQSNHLPPFDPSMLREHAGTGTVMEAMREASAEPTSNPLKRVEWLDVGEDYPGHQVKLWLNPPTALRKGFTEIEDDQVRVLAILKLCTIEHRVLPGEQPWQHPDQPGPMPPPSTDEFWELVPDDILSVIAARVLGEQKKAKSRAERTFAAFTDGSPDSPEAAVPSSTPAASSLGAGTADPTT